MLPPCSLYLDSLLLPAVPRAHRSPGKALSKQVPGGGAQHFRQSIEDKTRFCVPFVATSADTVTPHAAGGQARGGSSWV